MFSCSQVGSAGTSVESAFLVGIQMGRLSVRVGAGADSVNELGIWVYDRE